MQQTIARAEFDVPGQLGPVERGKVADTYTLAHYKGDLLVAVRTDRISAFDKVLDSLVPGKGHVINSLSAAMLRRTTNIVPNWFLDEPDPNVTIGYKADEVIPLEIIVRSKLAGGMWRKYEDGQREFSGVTVEDGLKKYQALPMPIVTPTTKDSQGDREISQEEILDRGLTTPRLLQSVYASSLRLYKFGRETARKNGMQMADSKFEFGLRNGKLMLIDEVFTPDSSRFYITEELDAYNTGHRTDPPTEMSKECFRDWLRSVGFEGSHDQELPLIPDGVVNATGDIYKKVYERIMREPFAMPTEDINPQVRMWTNILNAIDRLSGYIKQ